MNKKTLLDLYSKNQIGASRIKKLLNINQYEFMQLLADNNIKYQTREQSEEEKKENLKVLRKLADESTLNKKKFILTIGNEKLLNEIYNNRRSYTDFNLSEKQIWTMQMQEIVCWVHPFRDLKEVKDFHKEMQQKNDLPEILALGVRDTKEKYRDNNVWEIYIVTTNNLKFANQVIGTQREWNKHFKL